MSNKVKKQPAIPLRKRSPWAKYDGVTTPVGLDEIREMYLETYLPPYQRLSGHGLGGGWKQKNRDGILRDFAQGEAGNGSIVLVDLKRSLEKAKKPEEFDHVSIAEYTAMMDAGYTLMSIDGNSTSNSLFSFREGAVDAPLDDDGERYFWEDLEKPITDALNQKSMNVTKLACHYNDAIRLFDRHNRGMAPKKTQTLMSGKTPALKWIASLTDEARHTWESPGVIASTPEYPYSPFHMFKNQDACDKEDHAEAFCKFVVQLEKGFTQKNTRADLLAKFFDTHSDLSKETKEIATLILGQMKLTSDIFFKEAHEKANQKLRKRLVKWGTRKRGKRPAKKVEEFQKLENAAEFFVAQIVPFVAYLHKYEIIDDGIAGKKFFQWWYDLHNALELNSKELRLAEAESSYVYWLSHYNDGSCVSKILTVWDKLFEEEIPYLLKEKIIQKLPPKRTHRHRFTFKQAMKRKFLDGHVDVKGNKLTSWDMMLGKYDRGHRVAHHNYGPTTFENLINEPRGENRSNKATDPHADPVEEFEDGL